MRLLIIFFLTSACTSYSPEDLRGTWQTENERGDLLVMQFSDSLALIYNGGVNELFVYACQIRGNKLELEFRDGHIPNTEKYAVRISDYSDTSMKLMYADKSSLTFERYSDRNPEIHPGQLLYYESLYREQLAGLNVPPRDPPDFNEIIGFDCGIAGELTHPPIIVQGLLKDKKYEALEGLVVNGNTAESVLASFALLTLEERGIWDIGAARDKIMEWKTSERKIQTCITDSTWDFYSANRLFEDSNPFGIQIREWVDSKISR